jgi:glycosyltransferase involved in cell wall biosynthesis
VIKFSIIINTHNQNKYIYDAINSCLKQTYTNYEIIIIDSSKNKISLKKIPNNERKKIRYIYLKTINKHPELNQIHKILKGYKESTGDYILLLDGDDYFNKKKLSKLSDIIENKDILCNQDTPILFSENLKKKYLKKKFKNKFLRKYILNNWPQIYGTSSIVIKKRIMGEFIKKAKPLKWKYLAIDVQLILFCMKYMSQSNYLNNLTFKRLHNKNLGESYMNIFKKKFWFRRYMQFKYCNYLGIKNNLSLDYLTTKLIYFSFKRV